MSRRQEFKGADVDAAIKEGLSKLGLIRDEVDVEVISEGSFFHKAVVALTPKDGGNGGEEDYIPTYDELARMQSPTNGEQRGDNNGYQRNDYQQRSDRGGYNNNRGGDRGGYNNNRGDRGGYNNNRGDRRDFQPREQREPRNFTESAERKAARECLENILSYMPVKSRVDSRESKEEIMLFIGGEDPNFFIGRHGEFLDALQYVVNAKVNGVEEGEETALEKRRVTVDADFYRERRKKSLTGYAMKMARQAVETQKEVHLDPMNSYERRIIHAALQKCNEATTRSEGEGRERHIIITPLSETFTYGNNDNFRRSGPSKTRSFGYKKTTF